MTAPTLTPAHVDTLADAVQAAREIAADEHISPVEAADRLMQAAAAESAWIQVHHYANARTRLEAEERNR